MISANTAEASDLARRLICFKLTINHNNNWIGSGEINQLRGNANRADTS